MLSGGVDSSTVLAFARDQFPSAEIECLTFDYGQRHKKEIEYARRQAKKFEAEHIVVNIQGSFTGMLVDKEVNEPIPQMSYGELPEGISPTYVSYRNGTMLSIMAARAQSWVMAAEKSLAQANAILYAGMHADDAARDAYPDCTLEFLGAQAAAIQIGTYGKVRLRVPLVHMVKSEVVQLGDSLDVDFADTWSCYAGESRHCGVCPTCIARREAFHDAIVHDPTVYLAE
jgi:7-cyano-7-deazaguanine synthase